MREKLTPSPIDLVSQILQQAAMAADMQKELGELRLIQ